MSCHSSLPENLGLLNNVVHSIEDQVAALLRENQQFRDRASPYIANDSLRTNATTTTVAAPPTLAKVGIPEGGSKQLVLPRDSEASLLFVQTPLPTSAAKLPVLEAKAMRFGVPAVKEEHVGELPGQVHGNDAQTLLNGRLRSDSVSSDQCLNECGRVDSTTRIPSKPSLIAACRKTKNNETQAVGTTNAASSATRKTSNETHEDKKAPKQRQVFADAEAMKEKVRIAILKPEYRVENFYKDTGVWQAVARSQVFNNTTLALIAVNAIWISVEMDNNQSAVLNDAEPIFQVMEHFFCFYFTGELLIRFLSFQTKRDCCKDAWFTFDTVLVVAMVAETWVFSFLLLIGVIDSGSATGNTSTLRIARLFRLARAARVARLLRSAPELLVLVKGIIVGTRAVFFTLCLLVLFIYLFGIVFTQLAKDTDLQTMYFSSVPHAMYTLLLGGILADQEDLLDALGYQHILFGGLFLAYFLLAALTILNMLLGVLVDVINVVASVEKDKSHMMAMKHQLMSILQVDDTETDFTLNQQGFLDLLIHPETAVALHHVGVDAINLIDCSEFVFRHKAEVSFADILDLMFNMRGNNPATVKDIVEVRKMLMYELAFLREGLLGTGSPPQPIQAARKTGCAWF